MGDGYLGISDVLITDIEKAVRGSSLNLQTKFKTCFDGKLFRGLFVSSV